MSGGSSLCTRTPIVPWLVAVLVLCPCTGMLAQQDAARAPLDARVQMRSYVFPETGVTIPYGVFVPASYTSDQSWPLIVSLHGAGQTHQGMWRAEGMAEFAEEFGYIVVTPLGYHPRGYYGALGSGIAAESFAGAGQSTDGLPANLGELSEKDVLNVLELAREEFTLDEDRIYLFGYSMGGAGSYHLAAKYPDVWAGIAVAAPGSAPLRDWTAEIEKFRHVPTLIVHGDADQTIPIEESRRAAETMRELGMQFVFVEVRGGDHSSGGDRANILKAFSFFNIVRKSQRPALR